MKTKILPTLWGMIRYEVSRHAMHPIGYAATCIFLVFLPLISLADGASQAKITGKVLSADDGQPLPGVSIIVKGTTTGTTTDFNGVYSIAAAQGAVLQFSYIGYQTQEVTVGNQTTVDLSLAPDLEQLNEVVVVGYGAVKKSDLTGAVASVKADELKSVTLTSLEQGLQGRAPGVQVTQSSSAPGGGMSVRIRGGNSINGGNEPLYVVDGVPIYNDNGEADPGGSPFQGHRTAPNALASLNPNDIESIEILKDASATAIYGSRGANGVVLITTRRGKTGQGRVELDMYYGVQEATKRIDVLNGSEFRDWANIVGAARGRATPYYTPDLIAGFPAIADWQTLINGPGMNWQDEVLRSAPIANYQLSASGGNEGLRYAVSVNHFNQEGIVRNSGFKRYSIRTNLDAKVNDKLSIGTSLSISRTTNNQIQEGGWGNANSSAVFAALHYLPILPVRLNNGLYSRREDEPSALNPFGRNNPVQLIESTTDLTTADRFLGNLFADYALTKDLHLRVLVGADIDTREKNYYFSGDGERAVSRQGIASIGTTHGVNLLNTNMLTYSKKIGKHEFGATAVYELQTRNFKSHNLSNSIFITDITQYNDIGAGTAPNGILIGSNQSQWQLASYVGRVNYTFNGKYLLTMTARADGSSKFGKDNKWGFFPSVAFAWRLSDEAFVQNLGLFSNLKARVSYGETGNQEIGSYRSLSRITSVAYSFGRNRVVGYTPTTLGNANLGWESTRQVDIGVDMGFWDDRILFTADYYHKTTDDLLLDINLPYNSGFSSAQGNVGSIENRGIELALATVLDKGGFKWRSEINWSANRNKVLSLSEKKEIFGPTVSFDFGWRGNLVRVGEPVGLFYGYRTDGLYRTAEDLANANQANSQLGDARFKDIAGPADANGQPTGPDGKVDINDRVILGNPNPDFIYGWSNTFQFKNFELFAFIQGVYGNEVLNGVKRDLYNPIEAHNVATDLVKNVWTPENPNAPYPRPFGRSFGSTPSGGEYSDFFVEDGSFLRLRTVRLSYNLPANTIKGIQSARIYVSGQNLLTLTDYSGFNPEVNDRGQSSINQGIDLGAYPLAKTYLVGINLGF